MTEDEIFFLETARGMVQRNPYMFGLLVNACSQGIEERVSKERIRV